MRSKICCVPVGVVLAAALSSCTSTTTSVLGPAGADSKCQISVNVAPASFTANGGSGSVAISAARECTWTIATNANWMSISGNRSGQGEATLAYSVAVNPAPSPRAGTISVGAQTVQVSQAAAPCQFSLSRTQDAIASSGGRLAFDVSTLNGCGWTAASTVSWIAVISGQSGNASGTVTITVEPNAGAQRVGRVNAGGQSYTVTQAATTTPGPGPSPTPPPPAPGPTPVPPPSAGDRVVLTGAILNPSGRCPDVTFTIRDTTVVADRSTDYRKSDCGDVKDGRTASVEGVTIATGVVRATTIVVQKKEEKDSANP
jgi:hypothetical protein